MDILNKTIPEIHQALLDGDITVLELTKEAIKRAKNDTNNAFEFINEKNALEEAEKIKIIEKDNLLCGIPYVLKDNFSTKGIPTTGSSNILNSYIPVYNSTVYEKLQKLGCILIGKATLDELAMGGSGTTGHLGKTYNPFDKKHERMCGGSSCGSAAAVAAGIVPFSIGSDTGDSVRKPASYVGLVGNKPTWGRISRFGLFPFAPSLDHVAFFTRSVFDSSIILKALSGRDERDSTSSSVEVSNYLNYEKDFGTAKKKLVVFKELINALTDKNVIDSFNNLLNKLKKEGYEIEYVPFGLDLLKAIYPVYFVISCAEAGSNNANLDGIKFGNRQEGIDYEDLVKKTRTAGFSELIKRRFIIGSFVLMRENQDVLFIRAQKTRRLIVDRINEILKDADGFIAPAAPSIAPLFNNVSENLSSEYYIADNHLALANFSGLPSITVPLGMENNMPFGVNLTCKKFEEEKMLAIAQNIEDLQGYKNLSINNFISKEEK